MEPPEPSRSVYSIRAVQRVCNILDLIQEKAHGFTLTEVADVTDFPKSSAYRYLATLEARRYVRRSPSGGTYQMGPAFLPVQSPKVTVLADHIRPYLTQLWEQHDETVSLGVLDGYQVCYVEILESTHSVRLSAREGDRGPLHCTALGKAVAAMLDTRVVQAILESDGMPRRTDATITDAASYLVELEENRARGYAVDDCEYEFDGRSIAVPLPSAVMPAAISIGAPASRLTMDRVPDVAKTLVAAARDFRENTPSTTATTGH